MSILNKLPTTVLQYVLQYVLNPYLDYYQDCPNVEYLLQNNFKFDIKPHLKFIETYSIFNINQIVLKHTFIDDKILKKGRME